LDTRNKIISAAEARIRLADGNWLVIAGYFDPLTASVVERVHRLVGREQREKVLAVVLNETETLLSVEARSILMAALRQVNVVVAMPRDELRRFLPSEPRIRLVFDEEEERHNTEAFSAVVLAKQRVPVNVGERAPDA